MRYRRKTVSALAAAAALVAGLGPALGTADAAEAAEAVRVVTGQAYRTASGPQSFDVYLPPAGAGAAPYPGIVFVHGGGWFRGDKKEFVDEARAAAERGYVAMAITYTLGLPGYPREVEDVRAAVSTVPELATKYGVDPARIAVWGSSAGANLALQVATTSPELVDAAVGWSGPYDLVAIARSGDPRGPTLVSGYLGCDIRTKPCQDKARQASPETHVDAGDPPTFLANSSNELTPAAQATGMAEVLKAAGVPVRTMIVPGKAHSTGFSAEAIGPTLDWLDRHVR